MKSSLEKEQTRFSNAKKADQSPPGRKREEKGATVTLGNTNKAKRKADIQKAAPQGNDRTEMKGEVPNNLQKVAETKTVLTSKEKKRERKRLILSKLKEMKKKKQVKRLDGSLSKVHRGNQRMSDARFRAYGLNPVKHKYRMKHEAAKRK